MPIDQNDITKIFVESVKNLIESGEVKTQQEIADQIDLHRNALHLILKGERNIPPPKFKKFREIYITKQNAPRQETIKDPVDDYKDRYIALLEKTLADEEKQKKALIRELELVKTQMQNFEKKVFSNLEEYRADAAALLAYLKTVLRSQTLHRAKTEKVSVEKLNDEIDIILIEETDHILSLKGGK
jgi:transcriptional regulator with XRE-family HTH domain